MYSEFLKRVNLFWSKKNWPFLGEDALQEMVEHHHLAQKNVQDDERLFGTKETRERIRRSFKRGKRERSSNIQMHWDYSEKF